MCALTKFPTQIYLVGNNIVLITIVRPGIKNIQPPVYIASKPKKYQYNSDDSYIIWI